MAFLKAVSASLRRPFLAMRLTDVEVALGAVGRLGQHLVELGDGLVVVARLHRFLGGGRRRRRGCRLFPVGGGHGARRAQREVHDRGSGPGPGARSRPWSPCRRRPSPPSPCRRRTTTRPAGTRRSCRSWSAASGSPVWASNVMVAPSTGLPWASVTLPLTMLWASAAAVMVRTIATVTAPRSTCVRIDLASELEDTCWSLEHLRCSRGRQRALFCAPVSDRARRDRHVEPLTRAASSWPRLACSLTDSVVCWKHLRCFQGSPEAPSIASP